MKNQNPITAFQVMYEVSSDLDKRIKENEEVIQRLPELSNEKVKEMFHEIINSFGENSQNSVKCTLKCNKTQSVFTSNTELSESSQLLSFNFNQITLSTNGNVYTDLKKNIQVKEVELASNRYLVESSLYDYQWKVTEEFKNILDFRCQKAMGIDEESKPIEAWFTKEIESSFGPLDYQGLEGLILELSFNNGLSTYLAKGLQPLQSLDIHWPSKAERISDDEYTQIYKDIMNDPEKYLKL